MEPNYHLASAFPHTNFVRSARTYIMAKRLVDIYHSPFNDGSCIYQLFCTCPHVIKGTEERVLGNQYTAHPFLSIVQHEWLYYISGEQNLMTYPYQIFVENKENKYVYPTRLFFIIRNVFNLSICAGVATSILMAQRLVKG